jgi:sucrose-6F-phosphate phosphohydrolase
VIKVLATDLDGTFIPIDDDPRHREAMQQINEFLARHRIDLIYVSGRRWELIRQAIEGSALPEPDLAICNVGSEIRVAERGDFVSFQPYRDHLQSLLEPWTNAQILAAVDSLGDWVWPQPPDCQAAFKASFFFDLARERDAERAVESWIADHEVPVSTIISKEIDGDRGLIDLLPLGVNKGYALRWWLQRSDTPLSRVVFCGDSGNDTAAINSEMNGVAVGNADQHLRESIRNNPSDSVYLATGESTSGVLEGLLHYHSRLCC